MDQDDQGPGPPGPKCPERIVGESENQENNSEKHDKRFKHGRYAGWRRKGKIVRECEYCKVRFTGGRIDRRFCTRKCANLSWLERHPEYLERLEKSRKFQSGKLIGESRLKLMAIKILRREK